MAAAPNVKRTRLAEAAAAVLSGADDHELKIVVLNKALFYLDLYAMRDLGSPVTGMSFVSSSMGPTVKDYQERLVSELWRRGIARQRVDGSARPVVLTKEPVYEQLDERQRELAKRIGARASTLKSSDASDFSHANLGWKIARGDEAKERAINMHLAMQQILDEDTWLDSPATPEEQRSFDAVTESDITW
jgi:hypothetical protein